MAREKSIISRFPDFYKSGDTGNVLYQYIRVFGEMLDMAESDLLQVMRSHWVNTANNEGSRGFDTAQKGDLDRIFSLYLENLGGTSLLKQAGRREGAPGLEDDALYRERIKGLIQVLKNGASTRDGIIDIVAANLGIIEDPKARNKIRIEEYLPEKTVAKTQSLMLFKEFVVDNPNVIANNAEAIIQFWEGMDFRLYEPRLVNVTTGNYAAYKGSVGAGDVLAFFPDGTVMLNGENVSLKGKVPRIEPGESTWRFEAQFGTDSSKPFGRFDMGETINRRVFGPDHPIGTLRLSYIKLNPASFRVIIPWDIEGYTEKFDELPDNPRNQIKYIVDKVKAAGIYAEIEYQKRFAPLLHEMDDSHLTLQIPRKEEHLLEEGTLNVLSTHTPDPDGIWHEMEDQLTLSGVFDITTFDSLNTFA